MRIARVVTVCVTLVSMLVSSETGQSKRRLQSKNQLQKGANVSVDQITFTTLRPETSSLNQQLKHSLIKKRTLKVRTSRYVTPKSRDSTRPKGNRRRRQLHRHAKNNQVVKSYDVADNHVESQQIDTVQGPPEAFEEGAVRIEPVYRVSKNSNILDSITDIIRRIMNPHKTLGPLVGPFNFPGVGDKVYIRLLEQVPPDNLVIRLISNLPATKIESTLDKHASQNDIINQAKLLPITEHAPVIISVGGLESDFNHHQLSSVTDTSISSSNKVVQSLKDSSKSSQKVTESSRINGIHSSRTLNSTAGHHKRSQHQSLNNNRVNWMLQTPKINKTLDGKRSNSYKNSFSQVYQFYPPYNVSSTEIAKPLKISMQNFQGPLDDSITPYRDYSYGTQLRDGPIIPYRDYNFNDKLAVSSTPKYSLDFVSKKMKYLNLDGTVDTSDEEDFKPIERGPVWFNVARSVNDQRGLVKRMLVRKKEMETIDESRGNALGSSNKTVVYQKSNGDEFSYSRNGFGNKTVNETNSFDSPKNEASINYVTRSTSSIESTTRAVLIESKPESSNSTESRRI